MVNVVVVGLVFIVFVVVGIIFLWSVLSWRIPVVVLRYTGNKERPTLIVRRGRKVIRRGVPYLYIKGYKTAIRDYHAENYYPSPKTRYGGVVLWEFEDGWLTPCVPKLEGLSAAERARVDQAFVAAAKDTLVSMARDFVTNPPPG
jgi:hypothetical protein